MSPDAPEETAEAGKKHLEFTASTSFANPAVTLARSMTNTFAGIRQTDVVGFIAEQLAGAVASVIYIAAQTGSFGRRSEESPKFRVGDLHVSHLSRENGGEVLTIDRSKARHNWPRIEADFCLALPDRRIFAQV